MKIPFIRAKFKYMFKHKETMGFKTITIKDEVYRDLLKLKRKDESFSELFERLTKREKPDLMRFAGAWKMSDDEWKRIEKTLKERRRSADESFEERVKRLFE